MLNFIKWACLTIKSHVQEYTGNLQDDEHLYLARYLVTLKDIENVRAIEKRLWRQHLLNSADAI